MSRVVEGYNVCLGPGVSALLGGLTRKTYEWLKGHEGLYHIHDISKGVGRNSKKGRATVGRILRRLRQKKLISSPKAPTILYKDGLPCKGPLKTVRGFYQFNEVSDSTLVVEGCPFGGQLDSDLSILRVHRIHICGVVPGAWGRLVERGFWTWVEAGNLKRYEGHGYDKRIKAHVQIFKNKVVYQVAHESVPLKDVGIFYRDFLYTVQIFLGCKPSNIEVGCEVGYDFYAPDLAPLFERVAELKIYNHPRLGRPYARTEVYVKKFNPGLSERDVSMLMFQNLEPYRVLDGLLRVKLGVPRLIDPRDLRPKLRLHGSEAL